ncbi:phage tail spike protein [Enterocloster bolteae]|uniref:phage tail spike protein n=1 Tax=Enterocloster bolteae TaxID=208479 RepID=UPI0027BA3969|nr:phage tail spike protein [Enterocloster bolteae]
MYKINNVIDGRTYCLHDQRDRNLRVIEPRLTLTLNKTGALTFRIPSGHMYYSTLKKMKSSIQVIEDGILIYEGRILSDESDFHNTKDVVCEGSLSYLIDSAQRPFSLTGNIHDFLAQMVENHNGQVEERKQFVLGRVNVADENNELKRESTKIDNTWNTLKAQLIDVHGGYIWVEYRDGKKYLNYTYDYGGKNEQQIRFGVNLLDLTKYQDATNVVTCMIPYGGDVEYQDELGETQTGTVDITSVNDGKDYITAEQAVLDEYGKIWGTFQWPDITDPARLLEKAREYLKEVAGIPDTLKVSAVDLNYTGVDIRRFRVGYYTTAISKPHGVSRDLLMAKLDMYLDDPAKGSISLGTTVSSFTGATVNKQVSISKAVQESEAKTYEELARKIANATNLITGGLGGYVVLDSQDPVTGKKMHPWRILVMNTPDKETATNIIQINQNGIGFSTSGINGPYRNAWTIDGNLLADFITAGQMLADRVRGGILEVGGYGLAKDGKIVVKNANGNEIGSWDNTGLHVLLGVIQGSTIIGSDIISGTIDIGNGTFYVDDDGAVAISSGQIMIGSTWITPNFTYLGDFGVSSNGSGAFYSRDNTIEIFTPAFPGMAGPAIELKYNGLRTRLAYGGINTKDISLNDLSNEYGGQWDSVSKNIIELWNRIAILENKL